MQTGHAQRLAFASLCMGLIASPLHSATVFTGETVQGKRVISHLDTSDLPTGRHSLYFRGVQMGTGQYWLVPIVVAKGARPGKRFMLVAGVHGDEMSPLDAVQRVMAQLDPAAMAGTVVAVYDLARPAKEYVQRKWPVAQSGGSLVDTNRVWPGNADGGNMPSRHASLLWNGIFKPNTDIALDFHTAATSGDFTAFIFADLRKPEVRAMAELYPIEQVKNDPGYAGTLETAFVEAGIPALTIEIGGPRVFNRQKIPMFVEGTMNVLKYHKVIEGAIGRTGRDAGTTTGDAFHTIRADNGGWLELLVDLRDKVAAGQAVAIQRNSFGEVVREYASEVNGEVSTIQRDALIEPGTRVMQILYDNPDPKCDGSGCYETGDDY